MGTLGILVAIEPKLLLLQDFSEGSAPMILDCDWSESNAAIGGVLSQEQLYEGKLCERVIAYSSKKLSHAQRNYTSFKGTVL